MVTKREAEQIFLRPITDVLLKDLNNSLIKFDIDKTKQRLRHFLSQTGHESGGLQFFKELATGEAYEGRKDLGNLQAGDGRKFKGAGAIQLTGRFNYQALSTYLGDKRVMEGVNYVSVTYPFTSAGFWWMRNKMNELCDGGADVKQVTRRVNGGVNGLADRIAYYQRALKVYP